MYWDREKSLYLVELYQSYPELWNPLHGLYYHKARKLDCWETIGKAFNTTSEEVKKKMNSMLASFRRERGRHAKTPDSGKGARVSRWFAYPSMSFLLNRDVSSLNAVETNEETDIIDDECAEGEDNLEDVNSTGPTSPKSILPLPAVSQSDSKGASSTSSKRKWASPSHEDDSRQTGDDHNSQSQTPTNGLVRPVAITRSLIGDSCDVYGQHIANKLRMYNQRTRAIVEHEINNILFNADMGYLDTTTTSTSESSDIKIVLSDQMTIRPSSNVAEEPL